jgi:NAD(P)H dehydrogenase (quinone)
VSKVFIVYAHPEPHSFNGAMRETAERVFKSLGDEVRVSDLYAMNFNPVARGTDFKDRQGERLDYFAEQKHGYASGTLADDITAEIEKIAWCDFLLLQFPLYWFGLPAMLKGWIDRVFVPGFAFGSGKWYERGGLVGKRAMLSLTMAAYPQMMAPDGLNGMLEVNLWPIQNGALAFCGFDVLAPFAANSVPYSDEAARKDILASYEKRLRGLAQEKPLAFHRREDFDKQWKMKPEVQPHTVGHYFGRMPEDVLNKVARGHRD